MVTLLHRVCFWHLYIHTVLTGHEIEKKLECHLIEFQFVLAIHKYFYLPIILLFGNPNIFGTLVLWYFARRYFAPWQDIYLLVTHIIYQYGICKWKPPLLARQCSTFQVFPAKLFSNLFTTNAWFSGWGSWPDHYQRFTMIYVSDSKLRLQLTHPNT